MLFLYSCCCHLLLFTLIGFVPQFRIEGPETFYRFITAGITGRYIYLFVGLLYFLKDRKYGWTYLLVSTFFTLNEYINPILMKHNFIEPLTELVGSLNEIITFLGSFMVLLISLILTGIPNKRDMAILRKTAFKRFSSKTLTADNTPTSK